MPPVGQIIDEPGVVLDQWIWLQELIDDVVRENKRDAFARSFFEWHLAVRQFRKVEEKRILSGAPTDLDLEHHARCLDGLLGIGRSLALQSKSFGDRTPVHLQIDRAQLDAYVEELELSLREWHHDFAESELEKVRKALFSGPT